VDSFPSLYGTRVRMFLYSFLIQNSPPAPFTIPRQNFVSSPLGYILSILRDLSHRVDSE